MFAQFGTYVCLYAHSFALVSVFFVMDLSLTHCEFAGNPSCQFPESLLFQNTVWKKKKNNPIMTPEFGTLLFFALAGYFLCLKLYSTLRVLCMLSLLFRQQPPRSWNSTWINKVRGWKASESARFAKISTPNMVNFSCNIQSTESKNKNDRLEYTL